MADLMDISLDRECGGAFVRDYFSGYDLLESGATFLDRVNASFANDELALDWLRKSYLGRDASGVGVLVNFDPIKEG